MPCPTIVQSSSPTTGTDACPIPGPVRKRTERYQLTANGNVVAGVATYSVRGGFKLETEVTTKFCDSADWGDDVSFRFDPEIDVHVEVAACSGSELFATLSRMREDQRRNHGVSGLTVAKA